MEDMPSTMTGVGGEPSWSEEERLRALNRYSILGSERETLFDEVARLAADICEAPVAMVGFITADRHWLKAEIGVGSRDLPLETSFCRHAIQDSGLFVVPDLAQDPRFAQNPFVTGEPGVRFYAGAPLLTPEGVPLGTVCIFDTVPRPDGLDERPARLLRTLARHVMTELELRRALAERDAEITAARYREEERRVAEAALVASEARLRERTADLVRAQRVGRIGGFEVDLRDGNRSRCSPEYLAIHGLPPESWNESHEDWVARIHPDDRTRTERMFLEAVAEGLTSYDFEYRIIRPSDGAVRWIGALAEIEHDGDGRPLRLVGAHSDITARKEAEDALRVSEANYRALFEQAAVGVARVGLDGIFLEVNDRFCTIAGHDRDWLIGRNFGDITLPEDKDRDRASLTALVAGEMATYTVEKRYLRPDGGQVWVNLSVGLVRRPDGTPDHAVAVIEDITDRRRVEDGRQLLVRELNHRVKNLFAIAGGMVAMTARTTRTSVEMARVLTGRLGALASAHDLIQAAVVGSAGTEAVCLQKVAAAVLAPHRPVGEYLGLGGPPVSLGPGAATGLALVLHELATNAAKYGALSVAHGRLDLTWTVGEGRLDLEWRESGGPPVVPPRRAGFGSRLAQRTVEDQLGGTLGQDWWPEGLRVTLSLPVDQLGS
ncbi:PAS domain S-box protein [Rubellimicrobium rubrum]|uniref:histidine kinase n=1 Tax=Rubellimicrobium rubrum TaxID=2585369 RepID=A0A5C4N822_9RHOB|nr:PAS domain S-box protein [Rubellimicrobium rubrum]TNC52385.1 PAS domain S-box protein [Rubellimicrobium rubrum]